MAIEITLTSHALHNCSRLHMKNIGHKYLFCGEAKLDIRSVVSARLDYIRLYDKPQKIQFFSKMVKKNQKITKNINN